ncbi:maleylpyruvate isomerase family mycothiol-dependent enzyme [Planosporangium sp. 12N6]|uniref:maleylpyruvate isomerase family mycothiol-dependent enzyme n=1 Tax=Planosporangium spinosum TaxID=3402278 RepID=UPI003CF3A27E
MRVDGMLAGMRIADHIAVLDHDGRRLADVAEWAGLDLWVPTCPGWRLRDLLVHLGGVHRWATAYVTTGRSEPFTREERAGIIGAAPEHDHDLVTWFREGHRTLVDALRRADETMTCWTFLPAPSPLAFWARRQAHETAIHRADAESVIATVPEWEPGFAADGVDELLGGFFTGPRVTVTADPKVSMAVAATDTEAAWTLVIGPDSRRMVPDRHPADLIVVGPATDLYLLLWNRPTSDRLDLRGDRAVLALWQDQVRI